ncbi:hypothetical protein B0O99DRAFT_501073 [Bisporella sp. PMI_857]|nr:hypothetical protein B0O99DRAFT_501073 [Bisporella sp. PMI_857]
MGSRIQKVLLVGEVIVFALSFSSGLLGRWFSRKVNNLLRRNRSNGDLKEEPGSRSIVIVGASYAGYFAAHLIATALPKDSPYRVVVIEPNSHFHFTWVLPRFCIVKEEHKAFIPYGPYLVGTSVRWVKDRVATIERGSVKLRSGGAIPYDFLLIATGSGYGADNGLPSRVGAEDKAAGLEQLRGVQTRIEQAKKVVIVGGGAVGVELATDAKDAYPEKHIILVHSRQAVMHRFGPELQAAALKGLQDLGVEVVLGERVQGEQIDGHVNLSSGRKIECDFLIQCGGQKPSSETIRTLSPGSISASGHIRVKPTMQIIDETLPNVYVCGDVAETGVSNPNSRAAADNARTAADNIVCAVEGQLPKYHYKHHWAASGIKLTLGLHKSVVHLENEKAELLFNVKEKRLDLMSGQAWRHWSVSPFEDVSEPHISESSDESLAKK